MLVVGDNLKELCSQYGLVDSPAAYDVTSLTLRLHPKIIQYRIPQNTIVDYGKPLKAEWCEGLDVAPQGIELKKGSAILCCSEEKVSMPRGYFGLVQTKGSLARLFVSVTCNDGQVDPGYTGRCTVEIVNQGGLRIRLPPRSEIAQLFVFRTTTNNVADYAGRNQGADGPTPYLSH